MWRIPRQYASSKNWVFVSSAIGSNAANGWRITPVGAARPSSILTALSPGRASAVGVIETGEVAEFGHGGHRDRELHSAEGLERFDDRGEAPGLHLVRQFLFQTCQTFRMVSDRSDVFLEYDLPVLHAYAHRLGVDLASWVFVAGHPQAVQAAPSFPGKIAAEGACTSPSHACCVVCTTTIYSWRGLVVSSPKSRSSERAPPPRVRRKRRIDPQVR